MRPRVRAAKQAALRRRFEGRPRELYPGHGKFLEQERERKRRLGILTRKVRPFAENQPRTRAQPSRAVESTDGSRVAFVRSIPVFPCVNRALLRQLEARKKTDTFVLDTNVACLFKNLTLEPRQITPHRELFLDFIKSARLAAPPVAWNEYRLFGKSSAIPCSDMSAKDLATAQKVVNSLIDLFMRCPRAQWLALKEKHKLRERDYMFVVQSAMLYPKTTIFTNDSDFGIFEVLKDDIEALMYRKHNDLSLSLSSVTAVNVGYDLGLDLRKGSNMIKGTNPRSSSNNKGIINGQDEED